MLMSFRDKVYDIVLQIPEGRVATYGQVAAMLGNPRSARQVGFALRALTLDEQEIPWWRVVNREGYISINHAKAGVEKSIQADLLRDEGITVNDQYILDLERYLWNPLLT